MRWMNAHNMHKPIKSVAAEFCPPNLYSPDGPEIDNPSEKKPLNLYGSKYPGNEIYWLSYELM